MQTTQDIIKILPFEKKFRTELLRDFDKLNPDQKFAIERLVWNFYDAIYQSRLDENMQQAFLRAENNQEKLDKDFYKRIREQTERELQQEFSQTGTNVDLSTAREALKEVQEIAQQKTS